MDEQLEQENIFDEAKRLNPNVPEAVVRELTNFLNSNTNKEEYENVKKFGLSIGMPKYQLDFYQNQEKLI